MRSLAKAAIGLAALCAAIIIPGDAEAADPVMTQGAPSYSRPITASIGFRFVTAQVTGNFFSGVVDPTSAFPIPQSFDNWAIATCTGGATQTGPAQPLPCIGTSFINTNVIGCSGGASLAWFIGMIDLK